MSEELNPADEAGEEEFVVSEVEDAAGQEKDQPAAKDEKPKEPEGDEPDDSEGDDPEPEKKSRSQERRERRKAFVEELKASEKLATEKLERITTAGTQDTEPTDKDFPDFVELAAAKAVWKASQSRDQRDIDAAKTEVEYYSKQREAEIEASWVDQMADAQTRFTDFNKVALTDAVVSPDMANVIKQLDNGADVAYHLGQNRAEGVRIANLRNPVEIAMELGRISGQVTLPPPRLKSNAPDPIKPLGGKSPSSKSPTDMSPAEFKKWREGGGTF